MSISTFKTCSQCRHWQKSLQENGFGSCSRYPFRIDKASCDFCAEHEPTIKKDRSDNPDERITDRMCRTHKKIMEQSSVKGKR